MCPVMFRTEDAKTQAFPVISIRSVGHCDPLSAVPCHTLGTCRSFLVRGLFATPDRDTALSTVTSTCRAQPFFQPAAAKISGVMIDRGQQRRTALEFRPLVREGPSGGGINRPGFERLLAAICKGRVYLRSRRRGWPATVATGIR